MYLESSPSIERIARFIEQRRRWSKQDLSIIHERYGIPLEQLSRIRKEIRTILFGKEEGKFNLATTFHILLPELHQYKLAWEKERLLHEWFGEEFFNYVVYYDKEQKMISTSRIGDIELSFKNLLGLETKRRISSLEFFHRFVEKITQLEESESLIDTVRKNLQHLLTSQGYFRDIPKNQRALIVDRLSKRLVEVFKEHQDFFTTGPASLEDNIEKFNQLREYLFRNTHLTPLLGTFSLSEENYLDPPKERYFIVLACVLGEINHFGAEWASRTKEGNIQPGALNSLRAQLGLPPVPEPAPDVFVERPAFTQPFLDVTTLRAIFDNTLDSIIRIAAINGGDQPVDQLFTPLSWDIRGANLEIVRRIRLLDFVRNFDRFLDQPLRKVEVSEMCHHAGLLESGECQQFLESVETETMSMKDFIRLRTKDGKIIMRRLKNYLAKQYVAHPDLFLNKWRIDPSKLHLLEAVTLSASRGVASFGISLPLNLPLSHKDIFEFLLLEDVALSA